ncbi:MAG: LysM domain-containing protein [Gemmatimonadales bacterium]
MRKTTIFRSKAWLLAVGLLVGGQTLQAQQTTQLPEVHIVSEGETLWGIAEQYFGDPFLWPEIYRLNTMVVEDPHWIFPGEELRLAGMPLVQTVEPPVEDPQNVQQPPPGQNPPPQQQPIDVPPPPPVMPQPPPTDMSPTVFSPTGPVEVVTQTTVGATNAHRPVRRGEFYSAGFLTELEVLPFGRIKRSVGQVEMDRLPDASSTLIFGEIEIEAPDGASYAVDDALLIVRKGDKVKDWGRIIVPTGIAVVISATPEGTFARVMSQYYPITNGQELLALEPFIDPGSVVPVPPNAMLEGTMIRTRDGNVLPSQQNIVLLDLGRSDGVDLGDIFVVLKKTPEGVAPTDTVAFVQIVHRREHSSSGVLGFIRSIGVEPGAVVRLYRKMP